MKVAIAGAGSVGTAIAADLHNSGHDVLVLEQDPDLVERLRPTIDVTWVAADACEVASLDAAGLATVDVVVAATGPSPPRDPSADNLSSSARRASSSTARCNTSPS